MTPNLTPRKRGRPRKQALKSDFDVMKLAQDLEGLIRDGGLAQDLHEFQRRAYEIGMPKVIAAMLVKAISGDVPAGKLAKELHADWVKADISRSIVVPESNEKVAAWTAQAIAGSSPTDTAQEKEPDSVTITPENAQGVDSIQ